MKIEIFNLASFALRQNLSHKLLLKISRSMEAKYENGSSVLNDFRQGWSDIDILVLTGKQISKEQAERLAISAIS